MFQLFANHIDTSQGYVKAIATNPATVNDNLTVIFNSDEIAELQQAAKAACITRYTRYCQLLVEVKMGEVPSIMIYDFKDNDTYFEKEYDKLIGANKKEEAGKMLLNYCRIIKDHLLYAEIIVKDPLPLNSIVSPFFLNENFGDINLS